jgi:hypothetical protein
VIAFVTPNTTIKDDLEKDPGETTDLSAQFPKIKEELIVAWNIYAEQNGVHDHQGHYDSLYRNNF